MRSAALNTGPDFHLLDHIAPLAYFKKMPLITTEEINAELALRYYPQVQTRHMPDLEMRLGEIAQEFDALYECKHWAPHLKMLFSQLYNKNMELIFCPHGQSDKGFKTPILASYVQEDKVLIYGDLMIDMLKKLNCWPLKQYERVGNYRLRFYQEHQDFYDSLAQKEIFSHLDPKNRTLLYAPTWQDADNASSFFAYGTKVISELPPHWNLIVKLHPLLEQKDPSQFYRIARHIDRKPNALLVHEFPPVYPILAKVDAYLGDASSIGYDFLYFSKPMFFFPAEPLPLHSCGHLIDPLQNIYAQLVFCGLEQNQKELYNRAYEE